MIQKIKRIQSYLLDITVAKQESNERRNKPLQTLIDEMLISKGQKDSGKTIWILLHSISNNVIASKLNRDIRYCFFQN